MSEEKTVLPGGWELAEMTSCGLPEDIANGFEQAIKGAEYTPVLYVGRQIVAGVNYMVLSKQKLVVPGAPEHLVKIVINNAPTGEWAVVSIEKIA